MVLADVHVLYGQWEESEQMLSGLLKISNLRASYSQSSPGNEALGQGEEETGGNHISYDNLCLPGTLQLFYVYLK